MASLILSRSGLALKEIPLTQGRLTIGRKPHNDIQIDNLAISAEHAVLVQTPDGVMLEDLHSTNGTLVNGLPIKQHRLQHGDVITLGRIELRYQDELAGAPDVATSLPLASIQLLTGAHAGKTLSLVKPFTTLGTPGVQVAEISRLAEGYFLSHRQGEQRPLVNGQRLGDQPCPLSDRDVIEIAGVKMAFSLSR